MKATRGQPQSAIHPPIRYCRFCDIWFGDLTRTCSICGHRTVTKEDAYRRHLI